MTNTLDGFLSVILKFGYDTLSIPVAMSVPGTTVKTIAMMGLLPLFFVMAIVIEAGQCIGAEKKMKTVGIVKRLVLITVGLVFYDWIFLKVVAFCDAMALSMASGGRIYDVFLFVTEKSVEQVADAGGGKVAKFIAGVGGALQTLSPKMLILSLLNIVIFIIEPLLLGIRYALLCILYVFGPLALVFSFFSVTRGMLKGWFINLLQISFWMVTLRIVEQIIVSLNINSLAASWTYQDVVPWIIVMVIFIGFMLLVPLITAKLLSGDNLGSVGSIILTGAVAAAAGVGTPGIAMKAAGAAGKAAASAVGSAGAGLRKARSWASERIRHRTKDEPRR